MKNILITAIGGDIGQGVARIIKESRPDYFLVGTDMNDRNSGSLYVDEFKKIPPVSDSSYLKTINEIISQYKIDILIPINERELLFFVENESEVEPSVLHSGRIVVETCLDKLQTILSLQTFGLELPWTVDANINKPKSMPCIMKPRFSSGSRSIFVIDSEDKASDYSKWNRDFVYQELLDPYKKEVTCAVYRNNAGEVFTIQLERELVGGLTGWAVVIDDSKINDMLNKIAIGFDLKGSINVQLRITEHGPMVFEINPRFSSTAMMRHLLGFQDVLWSINELEGIKNDFYSAKVGTEICKTQNVIVINQ